MRELRGRMMRRGRQFNLRRNEVENNFGKIVSGAVLFISLVWAFFAFHRISTDPGHETVIVDRPFFGGSGGVREQTQHPGVGWYWFSAVGWNYVTTPLKYDEPLEHLATADNNFINYASYIVLQWKDVAYNAKTFGGDNQYTNNLKEQYRTIVRDVTKKYSMTPIMTDPVTLQNIETEIAVQFRKHISDIGLRVDLVNVNMGKALPDQPVITEMNNTATQQQRVKTEKQRKLAEDSRLQAEQSRANADNAYREQMKLSASEFVQLESIKRYSEACSKSTCTIINGSVPIVVGR
jgi:hypothetical protein